MMLRTLPIALLLAALFATGCDPIRRADTLYLHDGTVIDGCFARDEGVQIAFWRSRTQVGGPLEVLPRSAVASWVRGWDRTWDTPPDRADLTITHIEINPKLPSLHGCIQYDRYGRPWIGGVSEKLAQLGPERYLRPDLVVEGLKFAYEPGQELTLTAHVKNVGFRPASRFAIEWLIDDERVATARFDGEIAEMNETTFTTTWRWQPGQHTVTCRLLTQQPEIATINNTATDALWAFPMVFVVSSERIAVWHTWRSAYGTFCFEDYYRWHLDILNRLLAASVYPATPEGCLARVRLDRIVYLDDVPEARVDEIVETLVADDGLRYDQGCHVWADTEEELRTGWLLPIFPNRRHNTDWWRLHEWGLQLGLIDWLRLDYVGDAEHAWPDTGEPVTHRLRYSGQMMYTASCALGEVDAAYLNRTFDQPRGYSGEYCFALPAHNFLRVVDINGEAVPQAKIEVFQRGTVVEPDPRSRGDRVTYFEVIEDGNFDAPLSTHPVIVAETDDDGMVRLPDRPAEAVRTLTGFHRQPNPFGNIDVGGRRGLMLVRVTKDERPCYFWLDAYDYITAWFRGQQGSFVRTLATPYGSVDSPPPPAGVEVSRVDERHVRVRWAPPIIRHERNSLEQIAGYRVYRRCGNDGLDAEPWFPVATVGVETAECIVELHAWPDPFADIIQSWQRERFGVTSIGSARTQSTLVETVLSGPPAP